jgi:phosphopantetheinyl transferase (holo-ACP synthase)
MQEIMERTTIPSECEYCNKKPTKVVYGELKWGLGAFRERHGARWTCKEHIEKAEVEIYKSLHKVSQ